eukprot:8689770-Alexandrium_andersonii.AAC.2
MSSGRVASPYGPPVGPRVEPPLPSWTRAVTGPCPTWPGLLSHSPRSRPQCCAVAARRRALMAFPTSCTTLALGSLAFCSASSAGSSMVVHASSGSFRRPSLKLLVRNIPLALSHLEGVPRAGSAASTAGALLLSAWSAEAAAPWPGPGPGSLPWPLVRSRGGPSGHARLIAEDAGRAGQPVAVSGAPRVGGAEAGVAVYVCFDGARVWADHIHRGGAGAVA